MEIKLLTPISHLFKEQEALKDISEISDELEARERTCEIDLLDTTHYHIDFDLNIGLSEDQIEFLHKYVKPRENIETLTFQAARDCEKIIVQKYGIYFPNSEPLSIETQLENTKKSLKIIRDIVGNQRKIGIENNNFYRTGAYEICTSTDFLTRCYESLGLHLLFDVAHALVTCANKKIDFEDYKEKLLSKMDCKQVHLCEPSFQKYLNVADAIDAHNLPTSKSTNETLEFMNKWKINYLTIEFYKDAFKLKEYLTYLKSLIL